MVCFRRGIGIKRGTRIRNACRADVRLGRASGGTEATNGYYTPDRIWHSLHSGMLVSVLCRYPTNSLVVSLVVVARQVMPHA